MNRSVLRTILLAGGFAVALGIVSLVLLTTALSPVAAQQPSGGPLRHVVLFKFKPDATPQQIDEIVAGFQALPKKIDGITAFEWGTNNSPEGLAEGYTHCFVVSFRDAQARDAYLPHQAHKDFVAILRPRLDKVFVVDYFAQK